MKVSYHKAASKIGYYILLALFIFGVGYCVSAIAAAVCLIRSIQ